MFFWIGVVSGEGHTSTYKTEQIQQQHFVHFLKAPCTRNEKTYIEEKELSKNMLLTTL